MDPWDNCRCASCVLRVVIHGTWHLTTPTHKHTARNWGVGARPPQDHRRHCCRQPGPWSAPTFPHVQSLQSETYGRAGPHLFKGAAARKGAAVAPVQAQWVFEQAKRAGGGAHSHAAVCCGTRMVLVGAFFLHVGPVHTNTSQKCTRRRWCLIGRWVWARWCGSICSRRGLHSRMHPSTFHCWCCPFCWPASALGMHRKAMRLTLDCAGDERETMTWTFECTVFVCACCVLWFALLACHFRLCSFMHS